MKNSFWKQNIESLIVETAIAHSNDESWFDADGKIIQCETHWTDRKDVETLARDIAAKVIKYFEEEQDD